MKLWNLPRHVFDYWHFGMNLCEEFCMFCSVDLSGKEWKGNDWQSRYRKEEVKVVHRNDSKDVAEFDAFTMCTHKHGHVRPHTRTHTDQTWGQDIKNIHLR